MKHFEQYPYLLPILIVVAIWELVWKAIAMWKAAKNDNKVVYVLLIILNTAGLFPIAYILINRKKRY